MKYMVNFVVADIRRHTLMVPRYVIEHVHELASPEASLVNEWNDQGDLAEVYELIREISGKEGKHA